MPSSQMRASALARGRHPSAASAYHEAYVALEVSASKAQALVDQVLRIALMLTDARTPIARTNEWKSARIDELPTLLDALGESGQSMRLAKLPKAEQLLEAIADWRKKRNYLQRLWNILAVEARMALKSPETLD
jgi:hypothetical protein